MRGLLFILFVAGMTAWVGGSLGYVLYLRWKRPMDYAASYEDDVLW